MARFIFQQSTSQVLEMSDSVHIFNLNYQSNLDGSMENSRFNMSMFLSSLSRSFSNRLRDTDAFAAMVPCGPLVVLNIGYFMRMSTIWCASLSVQFSCC